MDRCWEDQYLVDFPLVTGCGRVFKVPCSLKVMRELLTDKTGNKMDLFFKSFFANISMDNPDKALLAMEFLNPAVVGTTIEREHSYSKPAIEDPDDTSYLYEDE
ncbi:hypothetical protein GHT06_016612 [Daphnia sinensis]|uniref:Uncharacterized protein n=1 Tax=Daphnia sinensis TaxID=1820382 RepID=A0AAD5KNM6_9CRUS|nr:hypothetical protein GHT06_016612 [Daphnia sinensis]